MVFVLNASLALAAEDVQGFWTTIDDESGQAKSVVQIYAYQGKYYGRVVHLFKNKEAVAKLPNAPKILGMDVIWDLQEGKKSFEDGQILDPQKGKVYGCEIWKDGDNLIVRGKIAFLGRNQTWLPNSEWNKKTDEEKTLIPQKPVL